jgi:signal peptidase I
MSTPKRRPSPPDGRTLEAALAAWKQSGGEHLIPIGGRSMLPLIRDGDRVLVRHGQTEVRRGDIVVFRQGDQLIAHRVLRICQGDTGRDTGRDAGHDTDLIFITKGDNVLHLDRPLPGSKILGRVLAVRRGNQHLSLNTAGWRLAGWLIAAGMLPAATVYSKIRNLKRKKWQKRER